MSEAALRLAATQAGYNEDDQNEILREYMRNGGQNLDPAETAWCAAFVNATFGQLGIAGTDSLAARSFENWGEDVTDNPRPGDVAVFSRYQPDHPNPGHVGFFTGRYDEAGNPIILGGNQNDSVSEKAYPKERLLGFRRAPGNGQGTAAGLTPSTPMAGLDYAQQGTPAPDYGMGMPEGYGLNTYQSDPDFNPDLAYADPNVGYGLGRLGRRLA